MEPQVFTNIRFNGSDYLPSLDDERLTKQINKLWYCMKDGKWMTLSEIEDYIGAPQASISADLRHLRKKRFGSHTILKKRRGEESNGLWEYKLIPNIS
jgi:hypothetical protein